MRKISARVTDAPRKILSDKVKSIMNSLTAIMQRPASNLVSSIAEMNKALVMLNDEIKKQMDFIDFTMGQRTVTVPGSAAAPPLPAAVGPVGRADDEETKVPAFFRRNLDYGEK